MELSAIDITIFFVWLASVIAISVYASRREKTGEDYFLAGRKLVWWLIGFSLIASNISTEQMVGMSGGGVQDAGLAIASYEWIAAISLVLVALFLLPTFLRLGIFTMPQFLEHRYGKGPRTLMAVYMIAIYVSVILVSVLYSGAMLFEELIGLNLYVSIWVIGLVAGAYTIYGGLSAVVWSDLLQGAALLIGGSIIAVLAFVEVGGVSAFAEANADKLHMFLPASHDILPWTAMIVGIWIPNLYYWGLNQYITQRTLGSRSLREGQNGIVFAAFLKILIPFIVVFPGIIAFQLYSEEIGGQGDRAYPVLISQLLPGYGLRGLVFAALFGAVMSSLDSQLNSASTIFTVDIYERYIHRGATPRRQLWVGRIATGVFVLLACAMAPLPGLLGGVFEYIQKFQGFISPGILTVFAFGMIFRRARSGTALLAMLVNIPVYGCLLAFLPDMAFLNHMAITFGACVAVMAVGTLAYPLPAPKEMPGTSKIDLTPSRAAYWLGAVVVAITVALYIIFW
jgi:SSS family solute:Na+ symporter